MAKTGCQSENLPQEFPKYPSLYYPYRKWCRDGTWERVHRALIDFARRRAGRCPYPSAGVIDSQSVKTTEVGGLRGYAMGKPVKGRKRHMLVDTLGPRLKVGVHAADLQDRDGAKLRLLSLPPMLRLRLLKIWADGGSRGRLVEWGWQELKAVLERVSPPSAQKGCVVLSRCWGVERTFAWFGTYRRLSKDYEACVRRSEGLIYLASVRTLLKPLAA